MEKLNIIITGRRNTGKSSLINLILGQDKAIVSPVAGTTTDPVKKSYEVPGFATLVLTDTAGIDDEGELGRLRIGKTREAIQQADAALLVISGNRFDSYEEELIRLFNTCKIPFAILHNKSDEETLSPALQAKLEKEHKVTVTGFSTYTGNGSLLIQLFRKLIDKPEPDSMIGALLHAGDIIMLVTPIDSEAPTGRLILPQVQMIRDILDNRCVSIVLQPEEIQGFLEHSHITPALVITDSQVFRKVAEIVPENIPLTSFSIVLAHHKGNFTNYVKGTRLIEKLQDNDRILMLESCSHHVSCEDIGRVKLPALLRKYTGKKLEFDFVAGLDKLKRPVTDYALAIQCGGCMITAQQLKNRLQPLIEADIPVSNYGMSIAYLQGIFNRVIRPFIGE